MHMSSSPAPSKVDESLEDWEKDETLLPQERAEIGRQKSEYERLRSYNIIRNSKSVAANDLKQSLQGLFSIAAL